MVRLNWLIKRSKLGRNAKPTGKFENKVTAERLNNQKKTFDGSFNYEGLTREIAGNRK